MVSFFIGIFTSAGIISLQSVFFRLAVNSLKLLDSLLDPLENDEKLVKINLNLLRTLKYLLFFCVLLIIILLPAVFLFFQFSNNLTIGNFKINLTPNLLLFTVGSILPFIFKMIFTPKSDYSALSKLFHELILDNYNLGKWLLDKQVKKEQENLNPKSILITGFARAGTTALTKIIAQSIRVKSLDYSNMPFLLYPRFWGKIYKPSKSENKQRAHKDGVKIGYSSVEALEEYFFKVILNDSYIKSDRILRHDLNFNEFKLYQKYQSSIASKNIYLAKNNNSILRLSTLLENPNQYVFLMFRSPLPHAYSLMKQHQSFVEKQRNDQFVLDYMDWLGHHEFGLKQKSFFDVEYMFWDKNDINFWLERWIAFYDYCIEFSHNERVHFISYEYFLKQPQNVIKHLQFVSCSDFGDIEIAKFNKDETNIPICDEKLLERAMTVYNTLRILPRSLSE